MSSKHDGSNRRRALGAAGAVLVLALAGCGSSGGSSSGEGATTTKAVVTTTAATTTSTAPGTTTTASGATTSTTAPATGAPLLTETKLGPLQIGQSLTDAKATGWVGTDIGTCELAGTPPPGTYGFSLDGSSAPKGLDGSISVVDNKIAVINVRGGAQMANGVTIEPFGTWTPDLAMKALNQAGYDITYGTLLQQNDLAKATSPDGNHYQLSLTEAGVTVAVPSIEVCE